MSGEYMDTIERWRNACARAVRAKAIASRPVAALYVDPAGCYAGLDGIDLWDERRDARGYDADREARPRDEGLVLHPPCGRWCQLASVVEKRWGKAIGDDGGCFEAALRSARRWGGVIEHPAETIAWRRFGIRTPHRPGGWLWTRCGGWVCHVEQGHYGHPARKATWLLVYGVEKSDLPDLRWGPSAASAWVGKTANHGAGEGKRRVSGKEAAATPPAFRDQLLAIAKAARLR